MKHRKKMTLSRKRSITGLIFISPWLIGFLTYYVRSLIQTGIFAFSEVKDASNGGFTTTFVGVNNFKYAFMQDAEFNQILVNSIRDIVIDVPMIIFFSLFLAILLNGKFRGRTLFRALLFLPVIMNAGVILNAIRDAQTAISGGLSAVAKDMTVTKSSTMAMMLSTFVEFGIPRKLIVYLTQAIERIFNIVRASGVQTIIFIASLQSISGSLYEVAKIEGATAYETFWKITFPMVSPLILTNVVYTIVDSFVTSEVVKKAEEMAFTNFEYGISSAMSLISTLVVCLILLIFGYFLSKKTYYYN
ncbi:MAG TPA: sugar ABC transporter permease [Lachnospiraceae bacterium]|jgi:ABC-type sugar transport system permease subunit|nr:sugar ABC transporter permease [Lachnospiraceae bacterium]